MADNVYDSSDTLRSALPLKFAKSVRFEASFRLEQGGQLPGINVTYETHGTLNSAGDNAVLICHALTGDSHVAQHAEDDEPGWWDIMVGPGKSIDTDRYFVICPNILGGCRGSTGPHSINPETDRPYGADFPAVTVGDMVEAQRLLLDHLKIEKLRAVVGGSLGGQQAIEWVRRYHDRLHSCVLLATSPALTSQAMAFDVVGRNAIVRDPHYCEGQYYDNTVKPDVGLAIARMLAHVTYLSRDAMSAKFDHDKMQPRDIPTDFEKKFSVGSYLAHQGHKFVERFDANSYVTLTMAMDLFNLGTTQQELMDAIGRHDVRFLVLSFTSDWLFPPEQSKMMVDALIASNRSVSYCNVKSPSGHDAFLLPDSLPIYGGMVEGFLAHFGEDYNELAVPTTQATEDWHSPTSIFHDRRFDYELISELIGPEASILDLGCGSGGLLAQLKSRGHKKLTGVELDEKNVMNCVRRGIDVIQHDLENELRAFLENQFDVVILSQTLQSIAATERIVDDMLRIGRQCIVSFPNFAYRELRHMLATEGRSPESELLHHRWYNSPNRRFLSIADFENFCDEKGINIHRGLYLETKADRQIEDDPNLNADMAIYVISR